jgi:Cu/Ag efflux pump CusA
VRVALERPYTFIVLALLILLVSPVLILRTPTDIFPNIDIPVIAVAWQSTGLNPEEMEGRITTQFERVLTTTQAAPGRCKPRVVMVSVDPFGDWLEKGALGSAGFSVDGCAGRAAVR